MTVSSISEADLVARLTESVAVELDAPDARAIDADTPFTDLGLDSTGVVTVCGDVEEILGAPVPPELLFDHPTIRALARHLAGDRSGG